MQESPLQQFGGRKFVLTLSCMVVTAILTGLGVLESSAYTTVTIATVGAYIAGNVVQKSTKNNFHQVP
jgi:hypothetical protein